MYKIRLFILVLALSINLNVNSQDAEIVDFTYAHVLKEV